MKKVALLAYYLIFIASYSLTAANPETGMPKGKIGITYSSFGNNDVVSNQELMGGASYYGDKFNTFGLTYLYQLNRTFDIETGIEYSDQKIRIVPMVYPGMNSSPSSAKISLINFPVSMRINFLNYFFVSGGIFLGIDTGPSSPVDRQNGIGGNLGVGLRYNFKCGAAVFVNPYSKFHALVPFSSDGHPYHILESGYRFGLLFKLNQ